MIILFKVTAVEVSEIKKWFSELLLSTLSLLSSDLFQCFKVWNNALYLFIQTLHFSPLKTSPQRYSFGTPHGLILDCNIG